MKSITLLDYRHDRFKYFIKKHHYTCKKIDYNAYVLIQNKHRYLCSHAIFDQYTNDTLYHFYNELGCFGWFDDNRVFVVKPLNDIMKNGFDLSNGCMLIFKIRANDQVNTAFNDLSNALAQFKNHYKFQKNGLILFQSPRKKWMAIIRLKDIEKKKLTCN